MRGPYHQWNVSTPAATLHGARARSRTPMLATTPGAPRRNGRRPRPRRSQPSWARSNRRAGAHHRTGNARASRRRSRQGTTGSRTRGACFDEREPGRGRGRSAEWTPRRHRSGPRQLPASAVTIVARAPPLRKVGCPTVTPGIANGARVVGCIGGRRACLRPAFRARACAASRRARYRERYRRLGRVRSRWVARGRVLDARVRETQPDARARERAAARRGSTARASGALGRPTLLKTVGATRPPSSPEVARQEVMTTG
jgi:hypothetical protein